LASLTHEALIHGHTVRFTSAGQLLGELASLDSDSALRRRLRYYSSPTLLLIDSCAVGSNVESLDFDHDSTWLPADSSSGYST